MFRPDRRAALRFCVIPAAVLVHFCLGGVYAWSAFVPALRAEAGLTSGQTQLVFGLTIATFTVAMVGAGRLLACWGPRRVALAGGLLFACGQEVAAASGGSFLRIASGAGLLGGIGTGFGYVAALSAAMGWFPSRKGLVTGLVVAGFGTGAVALSAWVSALLAAGQPVLAVFRTVGWVYGAAICGAAAAFCPPPELGQEAAEAGQGRLWRDPAFRTLAWGIFCGTFGGLLVIGNLKTISVDSGWRPETATLAISLFAVGNAAGRIVWGWFSDRWGYVTIPRSLLFLGLSLVLLLLARLVPATLCVTTLLVGFGYGACFVVYAAQVASRYGASGVTRVYPLIFLAYGAAGLTGPPLAGWLYDVTHTTAWSVAAGAAVLAAGVWRTWRCGAFAH